MGAAGVVIYSRSEEFAVTSIILDELQNGYGMASGRSDAIIRKAVTDD